MSLFLDDQELTLAYATLATGTAVNGVVGGPLAAALLSMDGFLGLRGWQWLFLLEGVPAMVLGWVLWKRLARSPESARFLTPRERAWLQRRWGHAGSCCGSPPPSPKNHWPAFCNAEGGLHNYPIAHVAHFFGLILF